METTQDALAPPEQQPDSPPMAETVAPTDAAPRRRGAGRWLLTLIVLIALAAAAWFGWQAWQRQQLDSHAGDAQRTAQKAALARMQQQIDGFGDAVSAVGAQRGALRDRLTDSEASNRRLQDQVAGLSQRVEQLEAAVSSLSRKQFSGHDGMLLDDAEMLLQLAAQRYSVLNDGAGAERALTLATQALAGVDDASYAGVRQRISSALAALASSQPAAHQAAIESIATLRSRWPTLPLQPLDVAPPEAARGAWQRAWHALSQLVRIRRDDAGDLTDARLARQLAVLDLASAQAALLDRDPAAAHSALRRVADSLTRDLDPAADAVVQAKATLDRLLAETAAPAAAPVTLGAALTELRNLRGVQAIAPSAPSAPVVPSASDTPAAPDVPASSAALHPAAAGSTP